MNNFEKNLIFQKKKLVSDFYCQELINYFEFISENQPGSSGGYRKINRKQKNSIDITINLDTDHSPIIETFKIFLWQGISEMIEKYPFTYLKKLESWRVYPKCNIQKYNPLGGFYKTHCEHGAALPDGDSTYANRILSWMVYLNDVTDKGGTCFPIQNITLKARVGDLYIWPAGWSHMHHGVPSPSQTKYIITGWINYI